MAWNSCSIYQMRLAHLSYDEGPIITRNSYLLYILPDFQRKRFNNDWRCTKEGFLNFLENFRETTAVNRSLGCMT
ncbi:hypothetical protein Y032_0026g1386 [Ancylostoma ceylanicum]|uniref:Uncharacterized protein n=1 Tax=Ancylostoma ceylanicum TaxID=53326 RepID=A0A016UVJ8_9BILA|nr:hypothetical protein Y032_0026g1386 [Ancylostoma ceylanicum]